MLVPAAGLVGHWDTGSLGGTRRTRESEVGSLQAYPKMSSRRGSDGCDGSS